MPLRDLKVHMPTVYGSSYEDMGKTVIDKYGSDVVWQDRLKWAWLRLKNVMTIEEFRNLAVTFAELQDVVWMYEAPNNLVSGYQNTYSQALLPKGRFLVNYNGLIPRGGMLGEGPFGYGGNGSDHGQVATEFVTADTWIKGGTEQRMFQTANPADTTNSGYNECFVISGVRLTGVKKAGVTRVGWWLRKPGSTTWLNQIQANGFNKGFVNIDGVPVEYGTIRAFGCDVGFSCEGTWGASIGIKMLECDGCGIALQTIPGADGTAAGGRIDVGLKVEDGVTADIPIANTTALRLEGQYCVTVRGNFSYKNGAKAANGLVVLKPTIGKDAQGNEQKQSSYLHFVGKGYGYGSKLVRNELSGKEWGNPGDYSGFSFEHYAKQDQLYTNCEGISGSVAGGGGTTPTDPVNPPPGDPSFIKRAASWSVLAFKSAPADGFGTHEPAKMLDGSPTSFWHSGTSQTATGTDYLVMSLDKAYSIAGLVLDIHPTDFQNDYPSGIVVEVLSGGIWKPCPLTSASYGKRTDVRFKPIVGTKIRWATTQAKGSWWVIAEANLVAG